MKLSAGAPAGCKAMVREAPEDDETQDLNQAFSSVLGAGGTVDVGNTRHISVQCPPLLTR